MWRLLVVAVIGCSSPTPSRPVVEPAKPTVVEAPFEPTGPGLRLPGDVRPQRYALDLALLPDQPTASGKLRIDVRVIRPTRVVWMHGEGLAIAKASVAGNVARVVTAEHGMIGLVAPIEIAAGTTTIDIAYTAPIERARSRGIYADREGEDWFAYTFFEPMDARRAFPCFDEPGYKAPWQLTFRVRRDHVALGNAAVVRVSDERDNMKRVELAATKPLASYAIAFVVGPFEIVDGGVAGRGKTPVRFIVPPGRAGELDYAKQVTPRVITAHEDYIDMADPFGKLDIAVVPRYWGTMEHPGIVAMGQPLTLIRGDQATRARNHWYTNIFAHEYAHYWFGNLVTPLWWDDTWLNEGLGQWMDLKITDAIDPSWRSYESRVWSSAMAMTADETRAAHAMRNPVATEEGIAASFDNALTYAKGASVLRMFEAHAGEDKWRDFLRVHVRKHAWGNATAEDFLKLAREQLGSFVEDGLRSFLEAPGVPKLTITCTAKRLEVTQSRSLPSGASSESKHVWKFPVCLRYGDKKTSTTWCFEHVGPTVSREVTACPTWIVPNAEARGYFRAVVDPVVVKQLLTPKSALAKVAKPSAVERMMLVIDLRAAVERGEVDRTKLLALAPLIAADPDERVAQAALEAALFRFDLLEAALYAKAMSYFGKTFGARASRLGWKRAAADSADWHELRRAFVPAVAALDPKLAAEAMQLALGWLDKRTGIDDDLVDGVLVTAAYQADSRLFDRVIAATKQPRDRTELRRLFVTLGNFRDPALATKALDLVTTTDVRDSSVILVGAIAHRETRDVTLEFLAKNIDTVLAGLTDVDVAGLFANLVEAVCEPASRAKLAELFEPRAKRHPGAGTALARALEQTDRCIANHERELPALRAFLAHY